MTLTFSPKQLTLLHNWDSKFDVAEGSYRSGKTFILVLKFFAKVLETRGKEGLNFIFAFDTPAFQTIVLPVINKLFPTAVFHPRGRGDIPGPHVIYRGEIILIGGYGTQEKWKKIWGSTIKCAYVTEMNLAHTDFVDKLWTRMASIPYKYIAGDLNPDNPDKEIYTRVNQCKMATETPNASLFNEEMADAGWNAYHFYMYDNPIMTQELIDGETSSYPRDSVFYKRNILGIRSVAEGLIFGDVVDAAIVAAKELENLRFERAGLGVDTSYSTSTDDTITFVFTGVSKGKLYILDEWVHNNRDEVYTASELPKIIDEFVNRNNLRWTTSVKDVFVDNADANLINEGNKWRKLTNSRLRFLGSYKMKIIDRIQATSSWLATGHYIINEECPIHIKEMKAYTWNDKKNLVPMDKGDHTINGSQYSWAPHYTSIGINT